MRLSSFLLGPLRLPRTIAETVRLLPPTTKLNSPDTSSSAPSAPSTVQGWVSSLRLSKNVAFVGVNDGTVDRALQVVVLGKKSAGGLRRSVTRSARSVGHRRFRVSAARLSQVI